MRVELAQASPECSQFSWRITIHINTKSNSGGSVSSDCVMFASSSLSAMFLFFPASGARVQHDAANHSMRFAILKTRRVLKMRVRNVLAQCSTPLASMRGEVSVGVRDGDKRIAI